MVCSSSDNTLRDQSNHACLFSLFYIKFVFLHHLTYCIGKYIYFEPHARQANHSFYFLLSSLPKASSISACQWCRSTSLCRSTNHFIDLVDWKDTVTFIHNRKRLIFYGMDMCTSSTAQYDPSQIFVSVGNLDSQISYAIMPAVS